MEQLYFAKWIPVEGEIKEGDNYVRPGGLLNKRLEAGFPYPFDWKKVQLFLCSSDVAVEEECFVEDEYVGQHKPTVIKDIIKEEGLEDVLILSNHRNIKCNAVYKVIGKVSDEAVWVKPGMRFTEEQLRWKYEGFPKLSHWMPNALKTVAVLCSNCKTFH